jgi:hypothetical protein
MQINPLDETQEVSLSADQRNLQKAVLMSISAYIKAARELIKGKYAHLREYVPIHLRDPGMIACICCQDGIIVRYDAKTETRPAIVSGWDNGTLSQIAPLVSESVVYCYPDKGYESLIPQKAPEIRLVKRDTNGQEVVIFHARIGIESVIQAPPNASPQPSAKPYCLMSVINSLEFNLSGIMLSDRQSTDNGKPFLIRNKIRLPVGWECVEIFPFPNINNWKPEYSSIWAENDLLASVVAAQFRELQFHNLDPKAAARSEFQKLLSEYKQLLDSEPEREETLQSFLKEHPALLCPTQIRANPKLQLGKRVTDFVFQDSTGDYLLVELEKSTEPLFLKNGDTSSVLNHARNQIIDWRRYLEDNLHTVQKELELPRISANPRALIVIGRSHSLNEDNRRKLISLENESPKTKIMTYDDIFESTKAIVENLLGPLWLDAGKTEIYYLPNDAMPNIYR